MRKNFKYFICIMLVFMALCTNIQKVDLLASQLENDSLKNLSIMDVDVEKFTEYQEKQAEYAAAGNAGCYISAFDVKTTKDGTAKFDDNDEVGNDSNDSNGRVRTFDYINYNLEYVTAIEDASQTVNMAYVDIEFTLEKDPSEAVLNPDTFNWCENMATTYYYEDGTSSTTWDKTKVVTKQVLTGRRKITNNAEINAIPGVGTLSFGVYVKGAKNGDTIQPKFKCWIEGSDVVQECVSDEIVITAEPRYNVRLARSGYDRQTKLVYFNDESTSVTKDKQTEEDYYGRMQNYGVMLELLNIDQDKGLKGIELPKGDITFDITVTSDVDGIDVTNTSEYNPVLWLWKDNNNEVRYAPNGRDSSILGTGWYGTPWVGVGSRDNKFYIPPVSKKYWSWAYDGGNYSLVQEGNVYHVTLKDYSFDVDKFTFPTTYYGSDEGYASMKSNHGPFSTMYLAVLDHFPEEVSATSNLRFKVEVNNFRATSISDKVTTTEMNTADNLNRILETLYPTGGFQDYIEFDSSSIYSSGDGYVPVGGTELRANNSRQNLIINKSGETVMKATNGLWLFDPNNIELTGQIWHYTWYEGSQNNLRDYTKNVMYAAKPDKTGWINDEEMNTIAEENLIYFESLETLKNAGYTCVGILLEYRNFELTQGGFRTEIGYNCKDTANVGDVTMFKCKSRGWNEEKGEISSWKNVVYDESIGAYGIGSNETGWSKNKVYDEFPNPNYFTNERYVKTRYENGVIAGGHTGGYSAGNSLLIIGDKTEVKIDVDNKKVSYDMDLGERTVTYNVKPSLKVASNNSEITGSDQTDNVYINVKLPKDLHYVPGSASVEPASVVENEDGTTTVNWIYYNRVVGDNLEEFTFDASIGKAGTKDDVVNMQQIKAIATISSDMDKRQHVTAYKNYSETTINIIKLATSSISKSVERELVEEGDDFVWTLNYGNTSEIGVEQVRMYDVLPYNGDGRGTSFHGSYKLKEVTFDFTDAPKTFDKVKDNTNVKYTKDVSVRNEDKSETILNSGVGAGWNELGNKTINGNKITFTNVSLEDITALYLDFGGNVEGNEFVYIKLKASPVNTSEKQQPKDVYVNSFYQYATNQIAIVCSNIAKVEVVERNLSGIAWIDINKNGMQDEGEEKIPGKEIKLYRTDKSKSDAAGTTTTTLVGGTTLYKAYDIFGNEVPSVTTDSNGAYKFEHLEQGTYVTAMSGLEEFLVTQKNAGTDKTIDSDAIEVSRNAAGKLSLAGVYDIVLPTIDNMTSSEYSSKNNDFGYYYNTRVKILKTDATGNIISGAKLKLVDKNGNTVEEWTTTTEAKTFDGKLTGGENYTLKEITAANGYGCVEDITFKVAEDGNVMTVTMKDPKTKVKIQKVNLEGALIAGAKLQVLDTDKNVIVDNITSDVTAIVLEGKLNAEQTYILHEVSAPKGYVLAEDVEFTVARDGKAEVSMTDDYAKGKLKIVKKDNNNEPLSGVKFEITDKNDNKVDEITTDATGTAISKDLITLNSPYKYKEIEVPENIVIDSTSYSFTLENDGQIITKDITNQIKTGSVKITKKISATDNSEEELLTGAKFSATLKTDNSKVYYSVEKETGIYEITGLQYGEYVIEEVIVPANTLKCANYDVNVVEHEKVYEKNITDTSKKMQITIFKEDIETGKVAQGDASLDGAEYTIYRDSACTDAVETLTIAPNADGTHSATSGKYLVGTYYVKETKAPTGYNIDKTVYTVNQNPLSQTVELSQHSVVSKERVFKNDIEIYKYLEATDSTEKQYLAGVEFSATLNADTSKKYSATTDINGYCKLENLPYGTYTLTETIYPDNAFDGQFEVDESGTRVKTISHSIVVDKNTTTIYSYEDITNIAEKMQITIFKEDAETGTIAQGDATLDGAEYTIYRDSACTDAVETLTIVKNADGTHSATSGEYLVGTYYVKETKAPVGYNLDETVYTVAQNPLLQIVELSQHNVTSKERVIKNSIEITKYIEETDSTTKNKLSGAIFKATLLSDESKVYYSNPTNNNGYTKFENLPYGTYKIVESTVPDVALEGLFYIEDSNERVSEITQEITEDYTKALTYNYSNITDVSKRMQITIVKEDTETGTIAQGDATLDGAEYTIYRDSACTDAVETLTIAKNEDGTHSATSGEYLVGTYYVKETKAPIGYNIDKTVYTVEQVPGEQTLEISYHQTESSEDVIKGNIEITKELSETDYDEKINLSGAQFSATLLSDNSKIYYSNISQEDGICRIDNLPYGTYEVEETIVPESALKCKNYTVSISENGKTYYNTIEDKTKLMQIEINKVLLQQTVGKTDAKVSGAYFTIYKDEACQVPYVDKNGQVVVVGPTDNNGHVTSGKMRTRTYYFKETTFPEGINPDALVPGEEVTFRNKVYKVEGNNQIQVEENKKYSFEVKNIANLGSIDVRKYDNIKGGSENRTSKGAILRLTLVSSKGTVYYDATIDENGYAKFENQELKALGYEYTIPYGEYEITEIKESDAGEHTYYYINPERLVIQRNEQKEYRIFADEPVEMYLRIVKKDSITKDIVAIEGARFKVWDIENKKFVSQMIYPSGQYIDEYETNENGNLILPYKLEAGEYIVYETKSPNGYYLEEKYRVPEDERKIGDKDVAGQYLKIDKQALGVDEDTPVTDQDLIYTVYMNDRPLKGNIQIHKIGNAFKEVVETTTEYGKKYEPTFKLSGIEGVKYNIIAAEDIYSADGNNVYVTKGTIVDTVVTGEDGYVTTKELYLGKYNIVEVETPAGYIPESQNQEVEVANEDEKVLVDIVEKELVNRKQSVKLEFRKEFENIGYTNYETEEKIAVFGIYAKEDLRNNAGKVLIRKDSLVNIMEMNSEGIVESTIDLPEGKYYVRELETSRPYHISLDEYEFDVVYDKTKEDLEYTINDGKVKNEIEYASMSIIKVPSSVGQETMLVNGMKVDTSILDETIKEILDEIKGMKKSEIVELFREKGISTIPGAEYTIYLDKECKQALLKENGEKEKLIIGEDGIATVEKIPLGKYYIKETKSPAYMEISDEVLEVELTIENKDEMIYKMVSEEYVVGALLDKKDLFTQEAVPNCVFEITNEAGEVILNSKTDNYGEAGIPTSLFENGKKYYFQEISAPEMYEINKEPQEFIARYDETTYRWLAETSEFTNIRKSKQVRIIKQDEKTGEALEGCVFSAVLLNEDGSIKKNENGEMIYLVENGVTDENGEYLIDKAYYGTYKFIEVKAPEGYEINEEAMEGYTFTVDKNSPERIDFIVTNTGDIAVIALSCIAVVSVLGIAFVILKNKKQRA